MENKLGIIITNLRKEKGITQKDLAEALNISDKAVSRWECGKSLPTLEMMFQISKYFNVSFNDLITARISDDHEDDEIVEEIIKEFSNMGKRKIKRIKILTIIAFIIIFILSIVMIFTNTYNRFKVYRVHTESDIITKTHGFYVETNIRDTLFLGDIKIKNIVIKETDIISVDLYYTENNKEYIIQNYSSLNDIYLVGSQSYIEIDDLSNYFDKLYLRVTVTDDKNNVSTYEAKLEFVLDFSNNKIFYKNEYKVESLNKSITRYNFANVENILIKNGFEQMNDNVLRKIIEEYRINYLININVINVQFDKNDFKYRYSYNAKNEILEVYITDNNLTIIQNYKYDIKNDQMNCEVGICSDYKKVLELMDDLVLYLLK